MTTVGTKTSLTVACGAVALAMFASGCARTPEASAAKFLESGKKYVAGKDYGRAILQFRNAARVRPGDAEPQFQLGLAFLETGDINSAAGYLQRAAELDPKHVGAQLKLAELKTASQNIELVREAEKHARAALAASPGNPDALAALAFSELRLGKPEDAKQHLLQALQKFPQHLKSAMTLARLKVMQKDYPGAEEVLKKAAQQAPRSPETAVALARFYLFVGNPPEAEVQLGKALAVDPDNAAALLDLGALQVRASRREHAEQTYKRLSRLPDKQYKPLYAMFLFQDGRLDDALREFEELARRDPKDRAVRTRLISAYVAAKRTGSAEATLNAALKDNPKDVEALLQFAEISLLGRKLEQAEQSIRQVLDSRPDWAEAHYVMARLHLARGSLQNHRRELDEALRLNPALLGARLELAQSLIAANSSRAALDLMDRTPADQRQSMPVLIQRNWALLAAGQRDDLRQGIDQALAQGSAPDLLFQDALLKLQRQEFEPARRSLEKALEQNPADLRLLDVLARSYVIQKQPAMAVRKVQEYTSRLPKNASAQHFLGSWLMAAGSRSDAREAFDASKAADPGFGPADLALARLDVLDDKPADARRRLDALLAANQETVAARVILGMIEEAASNYPAAIQHYRKVIETDRGNFIALNNLAYRLANDAKQPDEALQLAQQAKEIAPDHPSVEDTIGWAFYHKGIYRTAVAHLENAASMSQDAAIKYHLAMAYAKAGDRQKAEMTLRVALKANPNLQEAQMARALIVDAVPTP